MEISHCTYNLKTERCFNLKKAINIGLVGYKFMGKAHSNGLTQLQMFFDTTYGIVKKRSAAEMKAG
jgi:hypothetical protein